MRITRLEARAIQSLSFDHDLTRPITVFCGRNGAGKTTRLKALEIGLRGPGKLDKRVGDKASLHLRLDNVPVQVSPTGRIEVLRGLSPKHTLALQPIVPAGTKSVAVAQGQLETICSLQPVAFDLRAFTGLSADKQRAALLPFATFVPATEYADLYPPVPPFEGESGSDFLARVRLALQTELNALQGKKLAAEKASLELAQKATHGARSADQVRQELAALDARIADLKACQEAVVAIETERKAWQAAQTEAHATRDELGRLGGTPAAAGQSADELRAAHNSIAGRLSAWQAVQTAAAAVATARDQIAAHERDLASMGGAGQAVDVVALEAQLARLQAAAQQATMLEAQIVDARAAVGAVFAGQLEVLALLNLAKASTFLPPVSGPMTLALLGDIEQTLLRAGFPCASQAQAQVAALERQRSTIDLPFDVQAEIQSMRAAIDQGRTAAAAVTARASLERMLVDARARLTAATTTLDHARATVGIVGNEQADVAAQVARLQADEQAARASVAAAVQAEQARAQAGSARAALEQRLAAAEARVQAAKERLDAAEVRVAEMGARVRPAQEGQTIADELASRVAARPALQAELDAAIRDEGKVDAERAAFADAEQAKAAIEACKTTIEAVKKAQDDCLRKSLGRVADLFAPFVATMGATWRLGDDAPLGVERDGVFVAYDDLSDSEQLVFGIGLVLALSTQGQGLRLVMLDDLDACDLQRRDAIMRIAADMVEKGHLDQVVGTAWSAQGFDPATVQVIEVARA